MATPLEDDVPSLPPSRSNAVLRTVVGINGTAIFGLAFVDKVFVWGHSENPSLFGKIMSTFLQLAASAGDGGVQHIFLDRKDADPYYFSRKTHGPTPLNIRLLSDDLMTSPQQDDGDAVLVFNVSGKVFVSALVSSKIDLPKAKEYVAAVGEEFEKTYGKERIEKAIAEYLVMAKELCEEDIQPNILQEFKEFEDKITLIRDQMFAEYD